MPHFIITLISVCFLMTTCTHAQKQPPLETVANVDLNKYLGTWYEIAAYPQKFQEGCHCTTATYSSSKKGDIIVKNRCNKDSVDGKESSIRGKAFVVKNSGNAKLKVQFFWPFRGDYWIIDLADDYSYAVVSEPKRSTLWILSRTPKMQEEVYQGILSRVKEKGFDLTKLQLTVQCE